MVTRQDLDAYGTFNLWDALRGVPGVDVSTTRAADGIVSIRGLTKENNNRTLILLNGRRALDGFVESLNWESLPLVVEDDGTGLPPDIDLQRSDSLGLCCWSSNCMRRSAWSRRPQASVPGPGTRSSFGPANLASTRRHDSTHFEHSAYRFEQLVGIEGLQQDRCGRAPSVGPPRGAR